MSYKLTVKPSEELNTWLVFLDGHPVNNFNNNHEAQLTLPAGVRRLSYKINGPGGSIEFDLEGRPPFVEPPDATWPLKRKVPDGQTGATSAFYFRIG